MNISIFSYSFHRTLAAGKQDIFKFITDCQELGISNLELWSGHFDDGSGQPKNYPPQDSAYIQQVKQALSDAGASLGCIGADAAHIYDEDPAVTAANRERAYQWIDIAAELGSAQIRIDSGPRAEEWTEEVFAKVVAGYQDVIARAQEKGVQIIIENHWGPSKHPEHLVKLLKAVDGLGFLFDTNNWAEGKREQGWEMCAKYTNALHIKTFSFDEAGNDPSVDLRKALHLVRDTGYDGMWGIESTPTDGDEYTAVKKTIALLERILSE